MPYYTGVGSRTTPPNVMVAMRNLASQLRTQGWRLRSGAADGADQAFGQGATDRADIYVPWRGFGFAERGARVHVVDPWLESSAHRALLDIGCPHWRKLSQGALKLHARNVHQVIGDDPLHPDPSELLVCWTSDGLTTGGTATAIRLAHHFHVPVYNLAVMDDVAALMERTRSIFGR